MRRLLTGLLGLAALGAVGFVLICALLYFDQDKSIFFPRQNSPQLVDQYHANRVEIPAAGETLEGWWIENPRATSPATILYFGGNGEDVLYTATAAAKLNAHRILFVNYRGYGRSTGTPAQTALYDDALAIYDHAIERGSRPHHIIAMGRSLGSGVAAMLAASRPLRAVILVTPYDSIAAVASERYPLVPVRLLLRHPFPSIDWAARTQAPALFLVAEHDTVIPPPHAHKLFDAWPGRKQIHVLSRAGHNDIETHPDYYPLINEFLLRETMQEPSVVDAPANSAASEDGRDFEAPRDQKDQDPFML
jgi:pimeloyl-ACP methyl ester carboxylesterase